MKKLVIILVLLSYSFIKAQTNGGFENWTTVGSYQDPDNWQTLNFLSGFGNPLSAFKVSGPDKYSGNYALKIVAVHFPSKLIPQLPDTFGYTFNGQVSVSPPGLVGGVPYTSRPEKIGFYSKYVPVGLDTGLVGVVLHRNTPQGRDTIAYNRIKVFPNGSYSYYEIPLKYRSNAIPDSADIYFKPSNSDSLARRVGSALFIDDISFLGNVSVKENEMYATKVKVFPNPSSDILIIEAEIEEANTIEVMDAEGRSIYFYKIQNFLVKMNVSEYKNGNYYYKLLDKKNKPLTYGKFSVQK